MSFLKNAFESVVIPHKVDHHYPGTSRFFVGNNCQMAIPRGPLCDKHQICNWHCPNSEYANVFYNRARPDNDGFTPNPLVDLGQIYQTNHDVHNRSGLKLLKRTLGNAELCNDYQHASNPFAGYQLNYKKI